MPNVIIRRYNTFFDHRTNVQFNPLLEKSTGLYIGYAEVTTEQLPYFAGNPSYEVLTDSELRALITGKAQQEVIAPSLPAPSISKSGQNAK